VCCQDNRELEHQLKWAQLERSTACANTPKPDNAAQPVNADLRKREYLTPHEIEKLIKAARKTGNEISTASPKAVIAPRTA